MRFSRWMPVRADADPVSARGQRLVRRTPKRSLVRALPRLDTRVSEQAEEKGIRIHGKVDNQIRFVGDESLMHIALDNLFATRSAYPSPVSR